jgi:hypothetical protein
VLRYSPYVEVMCPLFTREALLRVAHTFLESRSGWGLDWVWPAYFSANQLAIIDAVGVEHTGPLGRGENYARLAQLGIDPNHEFQQVVARHGGFDRRLHRRFVRGKIRLPAILDAPPKAGLWARLARRIRGPRAAA